MRLSNLKSFGGSVLAISLACGPVIVHAQARPDANRTGGAQSEPAAGEDIVVTGSRISQPGATSASPIVSVSPDLFKQTAAVTLEDSLNRLPQLVPARGATSNDGLTGGITTLDLRGLGSNRTLVLMDSRRLPAATPLGAVDINNVPTALIKSVEILTGGASAAYGSDAIAGVVNFKLDHTFKGVQLDLQSGVTERGDGFQAQGALTLGGSFDDGRGHAQLAISYARRDGVPNSSRWFSQIVRPSSSISTGSYNPDALNLPTQAAVNSVFGNYGVAAGAVARTAGFSFNGDNTLFSYQTNAFNYRGGGADLIVSPNSIRYNSSGIVGLTIPFERVGAYAHVDYDISDGLNLYGELNYAYSKSSAYYAPAFTTISVPLANPFIPADLRTILASRTNAGAPISVTRRFSEVGFRIADTTTNNFQARLGLTGNLGVRDWTFDLFGSYGRSDQTERDLNGISASALATLVAAPDGGQSLCAGGLNLFGPRTNTACSSYIRRNTLRSSTSDQKVVEATVQGSLFTLPAGDVRFAVGADYRSDSFSFVPDGALQSGDVITFSSGAIRPVVGEVSAKEVYAELSAPILADLPLIKKLTLGGGYRYSSYNVAGSIHSYRGEANWEVFDALRLRGGYSRSVRSPSISELFSPNGPTSPSIGTPGAAGQGDPCDIRSAYRTGANAASVRSLCLAQGVPSTIIDSYTFNSIQLTEGGLTGGNINLKPEIGDTYTVGGVLTPNFGTALLSRLTLSVDYYNIKISGAVSTVPGATAIQRCYNLTGANASYSPTNVYCGLFGRSATTGQINAISLFNLNLGSIETAGIDFGLNWVSNLDNAGIAGGGQIGVNIAATRLLNYKIQLLPGENTTDYVGTAGQSAQAFPKWKASANLSYSTGPATFNLQYRYVDAMVDSSVAGLSTTAGFEISDRNYFDFGVALKVGERMNFRIGVNNFTDEQPPIIPTFDQSNTLPTVYDVMGRSYYVGVTTRF